ncbi:hypothetical protein [Xanthomonas melonis]|uniref:hypothetical protein n=1 Tax=Xanthomonas melonis TaxID=56456 RepID=UPI001E599435|nr:hypothetical protein [Xanthomonas melonis]
MTQTKESPGNAGRFTGDLIFVLGHEIQHSLYSPTAALAREQFKTEAIKTARSTHDYTAAGEKVLASNRADEATAEIAGWNAIVSAVKSRNPDVPPSLSSTLVWSPIPYPEEIGREEAFF